MSFTTRATLLTGLALLLAAPSALAADTTSRTIQDRDRDNLLEYAPGEPHVVRDDLAPAGQNRRRSREERLFFGQMTDTHVVDEESPLRVEFLDKSGPPFTSAYRPQESLSSQVLDSMVRQMRDARSPVTGQRLDLVMTTGDNSDNTQLNETRWMIDVMDGDRTVDPDSGVPTACNPETGRHYEGVRGGKEYYEPDSSAGEDGPGYSPRQAENEASVQRSSAVRDFSGLLDRAQQPFRSTGLGVPWYAVFGNHDALIQGNQPRNPALQAYATGCAKVTGTNPATQASAEAAVAAAGDDPPNLPDPANLADRDRAYGSAFDGGAPTVAVQGDPRRRPLPKAEWMAQHFDTRGTPRGHGFGSANLASGMGYYSFSPRRGVRFIALDSIAETGGDGGNLDPTQFNWIHDQLLRADAAHELAVLFAHHSLRTMNQGPSPFAPGDTGGDLTPAPPGHFGEREGEDGQDAPCLQTDPATPPLADETLRCLMLRHPSVVAFVNGHEHNNRITPVRRTGAHGLWEVNTASHIDWPQQSRVLDLADNGDGTLSIFTTILDHASDPRPGPLASISRELSYNDPDSSNGEDGHADARGEPADRNTELIVANPWAHARG
jgi:metallophosphoesterase (TIGR03767 family)